VRQPFLPQWDWGDSPIHGNDGQPEVLRRGNEKALQHPSFPPAPQPADRVRVRRKEEALVVAHAGTTMLENFGLGAAALAIFAGAALLYDAASTPDTNAFFRLLGAAVALAAGLITAALVLRSKLHWRRIQKQNRAQSRWITNRKPVGAPASTSRSI
jgi:hypothetical protein